MAVFKSVLEDYESYTRQQDDLIDKIEHSKDLQTKSVMDKEIIDLLSVIYDALASTTVNKGSGNAETNFVDIREELLKELAYTQSLRDAQIAYKKEKAREKSNLDDILSGLKEELVLIQKENEAIEAKLNDQDSLHLILKLLKSS